MQTHQHYPPPYSSRPLHTAHAYSTRYETTDTKSDGEIRGYLCRTGIVGLWTESWPEDGLMSDLGGGLMVPNQRRGAAR